MAARCQHCVSSSKGVLGRPKPRPRHQFPPSKAKAPQTCYTAIMNLTQRPQNISITTTMSTCSEKKPAQSPPAAPPPAPPHSMRRCDRKKRARAPRMARRPRPLRPLPPKTPRRPQCLRLLPRKRLPAPPTHTLISRQKTSHTDCAANSAANTKTRPFPENCALFSRKTATKCHPTYPVTKGHIYILSRSRKF